MPLKTDVHLSVIYSTRPVEADKVNLACHPLPRLWIALLDSSGSQSGWMMPHAPKMHHGSQLTLHLHLHSVHLCVFACVWVMKRGIFCVCVRAEVRNCQAQKATNFCT